MSRADETRSTRAKRRRVPGRPGVTAAVGLASVLYGGLTAPAMGELEPGATCEPASELEHQQQQQPEQPPQDCPPKEDPGAPAPEPPPAPEAQEPAVPPAEQQASQAPAETMVPAPSVPAPEPQSEGAPAPAESPARRPARRNRAERPKRRQSQRRRSSRSRRAERRKRSRRAERERRDRARIVRGVRGRPLPDPLPPAKRLDADFADTLRRIADRNGVSWSLILAVLRAQGGSGAVPADPAEVRAVARRLAALGAGRHPLRAVRAMNGGSAFLEPAATNPLTGDGAFFERVVALARYNRAVGLDGLVRGVDAVRDDLIERVLSNPRIAIYPGGRADIARRRVDVRVLVLLLYLASRNSEVTVTSLISGHGVFTSSGNVSAHVFGRAVDIAALGGTPILGNQQSGGVTERAVRHLMLLPEELRPRQLISLFDMGGPSFAMADHHDHIHAGY